MSQARSGALNLNVVIVREGELMVAHGLEHDIAAQGDSVEEAIEAWEGVLAAQVLVDIRAGREPLSGVGPADAHYFDAFKKAKRLEADRYSLDFAAFGFESAQDS
jgi:hypothetical protein